MEGGFQFVKTRISDIVNGNFAKEDEQSFVRAQDGRKLSRVRIIAHVVEKFVSNDGNYAALTLDDSTETIRAKFFQQYVPSISNMDVGDLVAIFGFLREYEGEVYLAPLITRKISDPNYEVLHKLEIVKGVEIGDGVSELDLESSVLMKVSELDSGEGVKIEKLADSLKLENESLLELIRNLLIKGDLYEPKKGFVKRIE